MEIKGSARNFQVRQSDENGLTKTSHQCELLTKIIALKHHLTFKSRESGFFNGRAAWHESCFYLSSRVGLVFIFYIFKEHS